MIIIVVVRAFALSTVCGTHWHKKGSSEALLEVYVYAQSSAPTLSAPLRVRGEGRSTILYYQRVGRLSM